MLQIKISGTVGEGKTTMALAILRFLQAQGFSSISVKDEDIESAISSEEIQEKRLRSISGAKVEITTEQLMRLPVK